MIDKGQHLVLLGLGGIHSAVELLLPVVGGCGYLQGPTDICVGLALVEALLSGVQLANDLLGGVALALHGGSPGQVWPVGKLS